MPGVDVDRTLAAPIDRVFDVITDHAGYSRLWGITYSELVRPGDEDPNGVGALRRIHSRIMRVEEEITHFERPVRMEYVIREASLPMVHRGGSMMLEARGDSTHVRWVSAWDFTSVPSRLMGLASGPITHFAFSQVLRDAGRIAGA